MENEVSKNHYKKYGLIILICLIILALVVLIDKKFGKPKELTPEQKSEILRKLNEDAKNSPPVSIKEKEAIINEMNKTDSKPLTAEEKAALLKDFSKNN